MSYVSGLFAGSRIAMVAALAITAVVTLQSFAVAAPVSYLDSAQVAQLHTLSIPVLLPRRLPPGYRLLHFKAKSYPFAGGGASGGTYELDFVDAAQHDILLIVSDGGLGDPPDYNDASRKAFNAPLPGYGHVHFDPMKFNTPYWYGQRVRLDRPAHARAVFLTITGSADPSALRAFCASIAPLPK
jgi:hypothetical protein